MRFLLKKIKHPGSESSSIYWLIFCAFLVRIILAQLPGFSIDTDAWFAWSLRLNEVGPANFYSKDVWTNYTPGFLYIIWPLGFLKILFSYSSELHYFILKLPTVITDLVLGYFIYKELLEHRNIKVALLASGLFLFNPAVLFNSAVWGQIDAFLTLFMFLSVFCLVRKRFVYASIFWAIAVLIKPQAIAMLPVFGFYIFNNLSVKTILRLSAPAVLVIILGSLPFFIHDPVFGVFKLIFQMAQDYPGISMFAYNLWGNFGFWTDDGTMLGFMSFRSWGLLFMLIFWALVFVLNIKKRFNPYVIAAFGFLSFYFLPTRVHERYLYPAIPFLILLAYFYKSRILAALTIVLSLVHFINIYYVYVYYMEFYLQKPKLFYVFGFYEWIEDSPKFLSLISLIIFALILFTLVKFQFRKSDERIEN